jgi:hypothetical protein
MVDRLREDLPRLIQIVAGVEHVIDLGPVFRPLLDLVEVAVVRDRRVVGLFLGPVRAHSDGVELWWQIWHVDFNPRVSLGKSVMIFDVAFRAPPFDP